MILRYRNAVLAIGAVLTILGAIFSVKLYLNLRTDIEELLPSGARSGRDLHALTDRLESFDYLAVLVSSVDKAASRRFIDDLAERLAKLPPTLAASLEYRIGDERAFFQKRWPLFVEVGDLAEVRDYVRDRIKYDREMYNPFNIFPVGDKVKKPEIDFEAMRAKYGETDAYDRFPDGYYATADATKRVMLVYLAGKHSDIHHAKALREAVGREVDALHGARYAPDLEVHYTGGVQSFLEEHAALIADLELSTIVVIVLVSLAMFLFYRDPAATAALILSLFAGTFWTFGISYFVVGYLNANSAFLGSIVIGNGINFGIIFLARFVEERAKGRKAKSAIARARRFTWSPTATAAAAAAISYGSLILTGFRGFRQFGVIGLIGMGLCWISAYTILPALLDLFRTRARPLGGTHFAAWVARLVERNTLFVAGVSVVLSIVAGLMLFRLSPEIIESDLSKLRNRDTITRGAGYYDRFLVEIFGHYLTPTVILARSRPEAAEIAKRLRAKQKNDVDHLIASVRTFGDFLPENQGDKRHILAELRGLITPEVRKSLKGEEKHWVNRLLEASDLSDIRERDLPLLVRRKFTEKDGSIGNMVVVEPPLKADDDIAWNGGRLIRFVAQLREVADSVTPGTPVAGQLPISADMVASISHDGPRATLFAFLAVVALVILLFRSATISGQVLFALLQGVLWLFGAILGFGVKINFLNFIALPITFGIGVDYAVNILGRYREEKQKHGSATILGVIRQTGGAVMLASLTTVIGYSSLLIAGNQAFVSFGLLAVLGEVTCVFAAVLSFPSLLLVIETAKSKRRAKSAYAP